MRIYKEVVFSRAVLFDLGDIRDFIVSNNTQEAANRYIDQLEAEINALVYLADCIPISRWLFHRQSEGISLTKKDAKILFQIFTSLFFCAADAYLVTSPLT